MGAVAFCAASTGSSDVVLTDVESSTGIFISTVPVLSTAFVVCETHLRGHGWWVVTTGLQSVSLQSQALMNKRRTKEPRQ